jgi:hypothetical protein
MASVEQSLVEQRDAVLAYAMTLEARIETVRVCVRCRGV